jgi:5-formyltetrahydrofolate cyclo-ligase
VNEISKSELRKQARERRASLGDVAPDAAARVAENFLARIRLPKDAVVAGYIAAYDELDPAELIAALRARGHQMALPRVAKHRAPLEFRLWEKAAVPVKGGYELLQAAPNWPEVRPDVVLVPLLAFDEEGYRIGYGGGYYDRTLHGLRERARVIAVGLGYEGQKVEKMPHDPSDEKLDWLVTEKRVRAFH